MADAVEPGSDVQRFDELIAQHGSDVDPYWREQVADALLRKGATLAWELG